MILENEIWKPINRFKELYEVSNYGRVKRIEKEILCKNGVTKKIKSSYLKPYNIKSGYSSAILSENDKQYHFLVHRLVAEAFIPNPDNKPCVNHIDKNRMNNKMENLEWVTYSENEFHKFNYKKDGGE